MTSTAAPLPGHARRCALVLGHPGHELRVYGWMEATRPWVCVLTDGSGHGDRGRLESTVALLDRAGASRGTCFGHWTDRAAYELILRGAVAEAVAVVEELAERLVDDRIEVVVADALEGFNPVHDLCRVLVDAAVALARLRGARLASYGFPLEAAPETRTPGLSQEAWVLELDEAAWERKLAAADAYPEMAAEVARALAAQGEAAFRREVLREVLDDVPLERLLPEPPFYETHGERQVAAGYYREVLRFREHFLPLAEEVRRRTLGERPRGAAAWGS